MLNIAFDKCNDWNNRLMFNNYSSEEENIFIAKGTRFHYTNVEIGDGTRVNGAAVFIGSPTAIVKIGKWCALPYGLQCISGEHNYGLTAVQSGLFKLITDEEYPWIDGNLIIGDTVYVGNESVILSRVNIGIGAFIGANSTVTKDCEPFGVYAGCPAVKIRQRFPDIVCEAMLNSQWWNRPVEFLKENNEFFKIDWNRIDPAYLADKLDEFIAAFGTQS